MSSLLSGTSMMSSLLLSMVSLLIELLIPTVVIIAVLKIMLGKKAENVDPLASARGTYLYLVCFVSAVVILIFGILTLQAFAGIFTAVEDTSYIMLVSSAQTTSPGRLQLIRFITYCFASLLATASLWYHGRQIKKMK